MSTTWGALRTLTLRSFFCFSSSSTHEAMVDVKAAWQRAWRFSLLASMNTFSLAAAAWFPRKKLIEFGVLVRPLGVADLGLLALDAPQHILCRVGYALCGAFRLRLSDDTLQLLAKESPGLVGLAANRHLARPRKLEGKA